MNWHINAASLTSPVYICTRSPRNILWWWSTLLFLLPLRAWERGYPDVTHSNVSWWNVYSARLTLHGTIQVLFECNVRGMRERSPPPLPKIAHPSLPRLERSQASTRQSAIPESPPGGTTWLITVSPVPGKLTSQFTALLLYPQSVGNTCGFRLNQLAHYNIHSVSDKYSYFNLEQCCHLQLSQ